MKTYNIIDDKGNLVKTVKGYQNTKRYLNELKMQQQSKRVQIEFKLLRM